MGVTNGHWRGNWVTSLRGFVGKLKKKWQIKFDMYIKFNRQLDIAT